MTRPQIVVNVVAALERRGAPTATGTAFLVYAGATGTATPVACTSKADAIASGAPDTIAAYVGDALAQGAPKVVLIRATAEDAGDVTEAEWKTALGLLVADLGPGQVLIPGIATSAAHAALLDHADKVKIRTVLLDTVAAATAADIVTLAGGLAAAEGAERAGLIAGWASLPGPGGVPRQVPASVITAGLCARNDAAVGHANSAPAGDQGRGAGYIRGALGLVTNYTDAEHDAMHDAGVSVFRNLLGQPQLRGWVSLSDDPAWRQLNWGRMAMQLTSGITALAEQFLFRNIDGRGHLFAELEGALRGYLAPLWTADALYGATAPDAFDVEVAAVNNLESIAAGELRSVVAVALSAHTEKVVVDATVARAGGVAA